MQYLLNRTVKELLWFKCNLFSGNVEVERVTACVANHPALADMAGYKAGRAGGYPHFFRVKGMDTPEKLRTMAYYDVVNFARFVQADTYLTWGFNDDTYPPTTSYAVYNTLACSKEA